MKQSVGLKKIYSRKRLRNFGRLATALLLSQRRSEPHYVQLRSRTNHPGRLQPEPAARQGQAPLQKMRKKPKPGPRCDNPTYDPSLGPFEDSQRRGPCRLCRDSGISVGTEIYEDVRMPSLFVCPYLMSMCHAA